MAIYVGKNNALLLKNDRSVVEFYKGDTKVFGYNNAKQGEIITADNVHPIKHKLKVKLSSDAITDFSNVSVKRYGKNLFDINSLYISSTTSIKNLVIQEDTFSFETKATPASSFVATKIYLKSGTYRISGKVTNTSGAKCGVSIRKGSTTIVNYAGTSANVTFTIEESGTYEFCFYKPYRDNVGDITTYSKIQLEYNSSATEYEQYKGCQTVKANMDGTVEGLTSLSPNMTVLSDTDGVVINCDYVKG